jgi:hypothetical protein
VSTRDVQLRFIEHMTRTTTLHPDRLNLMIVGRLMTDAREVLKDPAMTGLSLPVLITKNTSIRPIGWNGIRWRE